MLRIQFQLSFNVIVQQQFEACGIGSNGASDNDSTKSHLIGNYMSGGTWLA